MSGKGVNFGDRKINYSNFYKNKKLFKINGIDVNKILVSKKEPYDTKYSFKYFIGYNDNDDIRPLSVKLSQRTGFAKYFEINNKTMSLKKLYGDKINTNFQDKKIPKEKTSYKFLSLIVLDSVIKVSKKYYPQTLLERRKYKIKENKMENSINDDFDPSSSDESDNESDNDESKKSDND